MQCFVAMPFGQKDTESGKHVDFDHIYAELIRPTLEEAGIEPVRVADIGVAGDVQAEVFRGVATSELFIADVTLANPNVFYELGIRHALAPTGTVLLAAEGSQVAFDLSAARVVFYPPDSSDNRFVEARARLQAAVDAATDVAASMSPVFAAVPELEKRVSGLQRTPKTRSRYASPAEQKQIQQLRSYTSTDEIAAKLRDVESRGDELVSDTPRGIKTVLDAYRAAGDWEGMVRYVEKLDPEIGSLRPVRHELALALSRLGDNERAREVLEETLAENPDDPESLSLLGRVHRELGAINTAIELYTRALELDPTATYSGLQAAKLTHALHGQDDPDLVSLVERTRSSLLARYDGYPKTTWDIWDLSKDLELSLLMSDWREAIKTASVIADSTETWAIRSVSRTVEQYEDQLADAADRDQLKRIDEALNPTETARA